MTDRELLEMIAAQVGALTTEVGTLKNDFAELRENQKSIENEVRKTNNVIENDIKPKIDALFDGLKQNSEKLDRIEAEVVKHDEFILKRVVR